LKEATITYELVVMYIVETQTTFYYPTSRSTNY